MAADDFQYINKTKIEQLKVFYAMFTTIIDDDKLTFDAKLDKLEKLREELKKMAPDDVQ